VPGVSAGAGIGATGCGWQVVPKDSLHKTAKLIIGCIASVPGVTRIDATVDETASPHAICLTIGGGDDDEIAEAVHVGTEGCIALPIGAHAESANVQGSSVFVEVRRVRGQDYPAIVESERLRDLINDAWRDASSAEDARELFDILETLHKHATTPPE
jgi:hypothetical protein